MRIVRLVPPRRWPRGGVWCWGGLVGVRPRRSGPVPPGSRAARKPGARQPPPAHGGRRGRPWLAVGRPAGVGSPCLPVGVPAPFFPSQLAGPPAGPAERWAAPSVPAAAPWCCVVLSVGGFAPVFSAAGAGGRKAPRRQVGNAPAGAGDSARCGGRGKTGPHGGPERSQCPDKKRPAENTCRIVKGLDAVWAPFCPSKPCLPLSFDGIFI